MKYLLALRTPLLTAERRWLSNKNNNRRQQWRDSGSSEAHSDHSVGFPQQRLVYKPARLTRPSSADKCPMYELLQRYQQILRCQAMNKCFCPCCSTCKHHTTTNSGFCCPSIPRCCSNSNVLALKHMLMSSSDLVKFTLASPPISKAPLHPTLRKKSSVDSTKHIKPNATLSPTALSYTPQPSNKDNQIPQDLSAFITDAPPTLFFSNYSSNYSPNYSSNYSSQPLHRSTALPSQVQRSNSCYAVPPNFTCAPIKPSPLRRNTVTVSISRPASSKNYPSTEKPLVCAPLTQRAPINQLVPSVSNIITTNQASPAFSDKSDNIPSIDNCPRILNQLSPNAKPELPYNTTTETPLVCGPLRPASQKYLISVSRLQKPLSQHVNVPVLVLPNIPESCELCSTSPCQPLPPSNVYQPMRPALQKNAGQSFSTESANLSELPIVKSVSESAQTPTNLRRQLPLSCNAAKTEIIPMTNNVARAPAQHTSERILQNQSSTFSVQVHITAAPTSAPNQSSLSPVRIKIPSDAVLSNISQFYEFPHTLNARSLRPACKAIFSPHCPSVSTISSDCSPSKLTSVSKPTKSLPDVRNLDQVSPNSLGSGCDSSTVPPNSSLRQVHSLVSNPRSISRKSGHSVAEPTQSSCKKIPVQVSSNYSAKTPNIFQPVSTQLSSRVETSNQDISINSIEPRHQKTDLLQQSNRKRSIENNDLARSDVQFSSKIEIPPSTEVSNKIVVPRPIKPDQITTKLPSESQLFEPIYDEVQVQVSAPYLTQLDVSSTLPISSEQVSDSSSSRLKTSDQVDAHKTTESDYTVTISTTLEPESLHPFSREAPVLVYSPYSERTDVYSSSSIPSEEKNNQPHSNTSTKSDMTSKSGQGNFCGLTELDLFINTTFESEPVPETGDETPVRFYSPYPTQSELCSPLLNPAEPASVQPPPSIKKSSYIVSPAPAKLDNLLTGAASLGSTNFQKTSKDNPLTLELPNLRLPVITEQVSIQSPLRATTSDQVVSSAGPNQLESEQHQANCKETSLKIQSSNSKQSGLNSSLSPALKQDSNTQSTAIKNPSQAFSSFTADTGQLSTTTPPSSSAHIESITMEILDESDSGKSDLYNISSNQTSSVKKETNEAAPSREGHRILLTSPPVSVTSSMPDYVKSIPSVQKTFSLKVVSFPNRKKYISNKNDSILNDNLREATSNSKLASIKTQRISNLNTKVEKNPYQYRWCYAKNGYRTTDHQNIKCCHENVKNNVSNNAEKPSKYSNLQHKNIKHTDLSPSSYGRLQSDSLRKQYNVAKSEQAKRRTPVICQKCHPSGTSLKQFKPKSTNELTGNKSLKTISNITVGKGLEYLDTEKTEQVHKNIDSCQTDLTYKNSSLSQYETIESLSRAKENNLSKELSSQSFLKPEKELPEHNISEAMSYELFKSFGQENVENVRESADLTSDAFKLLVDSRGQPESTEDKPDSMMAIYSTPSLVSSPLLSCPSMVSTTVLSKHLQNMKEDPQSQLCSVKENTDKNIKIEMNEEFEENVYILSHVPCLPLKPTSRFSYKKYVSTPQKYIMAKSMEKNETSKTVSKDIFLPHQSSEIVIANIFPSLKADVKEKEQSSSETLVSQGLETLVQPSKRSPRISIPENLSKLGDTTDLLSCKAEKNSEKIEGSSIPATSVSISKLSKSYNKEHEKEKKSEKERSLSETTEFKPDPMTAISSTPSLVSSPLLSCPSMVSTTALSSNLTEKKSTLKKHLRYMMEDPQSQLSSVKEDTDKNIKIQMNEEFEENVYILSRVPCLPLKPISRFSHKKYVSTPEKYITAKSMEKNETSKTESKDIFSPYQSSEIVIANIFPSLKADVKEKEQFSSETLVSQGLETLVQPSKRSPRIAIPENLSKLEDTIDLLSCKAEKNSEKIEDSSIPATSVSISKLSESYNKEQEKEKKSEKERSLSETLGSQKVKTLVKSFEKSLKTSAPKNLKNLGDQTKALSSEAKKNSDQKTGSSILATSIIDAKKKDLYKEEKNKEGFTTPNLPSKVNTLSLKKASNAADIKETNKSLFKERKQFLVQSKSDKQPLASSDKFVPKLSMTSFKAPILSTQYELLSKETESREISEIPSDIKKKSTSKSMDNMLNLSTSIAKDSNVDSKSLKSLNPDMSDKRSIHESKNVRSLIVSKCTPTDPRLVSRMNLKNLSPHISCNSYFPRSLTAVHTLSPANPPYSLSVHLRSVCKRQRHSKRCLPVIPYKQQKKNELPDSNNKNNKKVIVLDNNAKTKNPEPINKIVANSQFVDNKLKDTKNLTNSSTTPPDNLKCSKTEPLSTLGIYSSSNNKVQGSFSSSKPPNGKAPKMNMSPQLKVKVQETQDLFDHLRQLCAQLSSNRRKMNCGQESTNIPPNPCSPNEPPNKGGRMRVIASVCLMILAAAAYKVMVLGDMKPHRKEPCVDYEFMRRRTKKFPWGDGNKTLFHNDETNNLPEDCASNIKIVPKESEKPKTIVEGQEVQKVTEDNINKININNIKKAVPKIEVSDKANQQIKNDEPPKSVINKDGTPEVSKCNINKNDRDSLLRETENMNLQKNDTEQETKILSVDNPLNLTEGEKELIKPNSEKKK